MQRAGRAGGECRGGAPHSCRTSHACSGKHVFVVLRIDKAVFLCVMPVFEGLLVGS
jgi:hypothetical protein